MKAYKEYMDRIVVDPELHEKIMSRLAVPGRRPRRFYRYALPAACAIMALAAVWVLWPAAERDRNGKNGSNGFPEPPAAAFLEGGKLYFNRLAPPDRSAGPSFTADQAVYFFEELTGEKVARFFKGRHPVPAGFTLEEAWAGYSRDGKPVTLQVIYGRGGEKIIISMGAGCFYPMAGARVSNIHGTEVTAGFWYAPYGLQNAPLYIAYFELQDWLFAVETQLQVSFLGETLDLLLEEGVDPGALVPASIPERREETLTLDQARSDAAFGRFVPAIVPEGFSFVSARRVIDGAREHDELNLFYEAGLRYIRLSIARETPADASRIVDPARLEHYDMSLYPVPWAESVPEELRETVLHPVFRREDLTLQILYARAYRAADTGDDSTGYRMQFSVLGGGKVIDFNIKGATPEEVLRLVQSIPAF
ncbi:MAG TPA: hypothetical protein PKO38_05805 [Bacillota bacterium]|jgi:hypothetical protein|nr:hypothetical protein [Bacillota bacterium]HOB87185.1 hypothetical protein [Bacillota bacterium]HOP68373.1 hypothetical protein [Bacillota bacterium]HPT33458.1 hypothetical protein [Bacillota bacterium]HPZ64790.1 hypothetical protein [Bacillota bacterium]